MNWYYIGKTAPLDKLARKITGNNSTYTEKELKYFTIIIELKRPDYPQRLYAELLKELEDEDIVRPI